MRPEANRQGTDASSRNPGLRLRIYRRLGAVLCLAFALSAGGAEAPSGPDQVIYPRTTTGGEPATAGRTGASPLLLVVALGAAAAGGWLFWRQRRMGPGVAGREARRLAVVESRSLGNRQYLVVADYDGRKFLLGVCPGRIELLSQLDQEEGKGT